MEIKKLLIVDDDRIICGLFKSLLEPDGYEVTTTLSGKEAIEKAKVQKFDIVFIDVVMPEMDGVQTLKELLKITPSTVFVMMTGFAVDEKIQEALSLGAFDFIYKPFADKEVKVVFDKIAKKEKLKKL
ncbi:MAG: response regulator [Elusimicrobiota bacterium]